MQQQSVFVAVV